eukprot:7771692-Ditylum_brightwellii.AAC.1
MQCLQISNLEVEENKESCLIDGGSNNGLVGAGIHLYKMTEHPERVDIIGASYDIQDDKLYLGLFHNYVGYCKGKSILSVNQSLAFGIKSYPEPRHFGGMQKI